MSIHRKPNGKYEVRWRSLGRTGRNMSRTFDKRADAKAFDAEMRRRQQLGGVVDLTRGKVQLGEFVETYWRLHATPNLAPTTRDAYVRSWANHLAPRVGDLPLRDITPRVITRLKADLEKAKVGTAASRKALAVLQSIMSLAVLEEEIDFNPVAAVRKPRYQRKRDPVIFVPADVEELRSQLQSLRDRTLVSVLAYSGPRPEEALRLRVRDVGEEAIHYDGRKTRRPRWTPLLHHLADDLAEWLKELGAPGRNAPLFPAHDGGFWDLDDWRNWRRRIWQGWIGGRSDCTHTGEAICTECGALRRTPAGSRPRDLRSSYITIRVYEGLPLTTIARHCGTSVAMLDIHYAGVIANWDGRHVPADKQIAEARKALRATKKDQK